MGPCFLGACIGVITGFKHFALGAHTRGPQDLVRIIVSLPCVVGLAAIILPAA